ncbi:hypothetical protein MBLNU13_g07774t1 [Cladosporium sp. NU13]
MSPTNQPEHRSRNASPQFRSIKAVFEHADVPAPRPFSRAASRPQTPTNNEPSPAASLIARETIKHQRETIDSLLEVPIAPPRPASGSSIRPKSSWIGPSPPSNPHSTDAMAHQVTITYSSPGLQPPVYITSSLSEPQWDLIEMDCSEAPSGEWEFSKTFPAAKGEYQYKFRLGPGDWWVCDESKPTVDDGFGDRNNVLVVQDEVPEKEHAAESHKSVDDAAEFESPTLPHERNSSKGHAKHDSVVPDPLVPEAEAVKGKQDVVQEKHSPLFLHEQHGSPPGLLSIPPETVPVNFSRQDTISLDDDDGDCEPSHFPEAPKFDHEKDILPARASTPGTDEDDDYDDMEHPPLMRHETLSSESGTSSHDIHEAEKHSPTSSHSSTLWESRESHIPAEADPNDPSLLRLDVLSSTSPIGQAISHSSQSPSLPSVLEDEEELEEEDEDEHASKPSAHVLPEAIVSKAHDLTTGLKALSSASGRPAALMTPPRTPDEAEHEHNPNPRHEVQKEAEHDSKKSEPQVRSTESHADAEASKSAPAVDSKKEEAKKAIKQPEKASSRSGAFETVLGLGLFVAVGVGAAWLAFMMQDPIKDGGAALSGAS